MDNLAKPKNRALFLVSVAVTGAFAGAAVWLFFFAMEHGIDYLWTEIPHMLGVASPELANGPFGFLPYPFFACLLGGLLIGLYEKLTSTKTDDLNQVMAKVKQDGCYPYDNLGKLSLAALLPLLFGGSIGPEAGKPSIKLTVLVIPTIQKIVTGIAKYSKKIKSPNGSVIKSILISNATKIHAAKICPNNFTFAGRLIKSSIIPTITMKVPPNNKPTISLLKSSILQTAIMKAK